MKAKNAIPELRRADFEAGARLNCSSDPLKAGPRSSNGETDGKPDPASHREVGMHDKDDHHEAEAKHHTRSRVPNRQTTPPREVKRAGQESQKEQEPGESVLRGKLKICAFIYWCSRIRLSCTPASFSHAGPKRVIPYVGQPRRNRMIMGLRGRVLLGNRSLPIIGLEPKQRP